MNARSKIDSPSDREERLTTILLAYVEETEQGREPEREEWLARHSEFAAELRTYFRDRDRVHRLTEPLRSLARPGLPTGQTSLPRDLGEYELLEEIGHGGMGIVYLARQKSLGRLVALKMVRSTLETVPDRERFRIEAETAARLDHPNIVPVYEVGEIDGCSFFTMKYIEGGSLADHLDRFTRVPRTAAGLIITIARAVHHAHQRGVLHRDLKPSNILLKVEGSGVRSQGSGVRGQESDPRDHGAVVSEALPSSLAPSPSTPSSLTPVPCPLTPGSVVPYVADFGLAKRVELDGSLTQTGVILGTPTYMAPEQTLGKKGAVTTATDVYGMGALLYALLTGRPPFRGDTALDTLTQIKEREPENPSGLNHLIDRDLQTICLKCLEKEPARRYGSAQGMADDLERWLAGEPILARPLGRAARFWRRCRRNPAVASLSVLALLFLMLGLAFSIHFAVQANARAKEARANAETAERSRKQAQRESALLTLERGRNLAEQGEGGHGLLWLARGLELATEAGDLDLQRVIRTNIAAISGRLHKLRQVIQTGSSRPFCQLTPDGKNVWVSSWTNNQVRLWDLATGQPVRELPVSRPKGSPLALSPDGLVLFADGRLWDTTTNWPLTPPPLLHTWPRVAAFRPDGQVLAIELATGMVGLWEVATGRLRAELPCHNGVILDLAFSPDGKRLAAGNEESIHIWDVDSGQPIGNAIPYTAQAYAIAWSSDSQTILVGNPRGEVEFWDVASRETRGQPLAHRSTVFSAHGSRDGRIIVTGSGDRAARVWEAATRRPIANLLPHDGSVLQVMLSPDRTILATASEDGCVRIWDLAPELVEMKHRTWVYAGAFNHDGRIALTGCADTRAQLWDAQTGKPIGPPFEHPDGIRALAFRPDGQGFFAACANGQVWQWNLSTSKAGDILCTAPNGIYAIAVTRDGHTLVTTGPDGTAQLWDTVTGKPRGGPLNHQGAVIAVAFSPDGHTLLTGSTDKTARLWDAATGQPQGTPLVHPDGVWALTFDPDGLRFFTTGWDSGVRVWDTATQQPIGKPLILQRAVTSMALSPDGQTVLLGSHDGMAQLFDLATGLPLGIPFSHGRAVLAVAISPDGRTALTVGQDAKARLWRLPRPVESNQERIRLWVQVITGLELKGDRMLVGLDGPTWQERRQRLQTLAGAPAVGD